MPEPLRIDYILPNDISNRQPGKKVRGVLGQGSVRRNESSDRLVLWIVIRSENNRLHM